uniref:Integrase zinc-binding domain-containing protein n=1 Tax=Parascaris equorum TaxID=6256 RepID=A0A914RUM8_PAREQ
MSSQNETRLLTSSSCALELVIALLKAIRMREHGELMAPDEKHRAVRQMYYWPDISTRTESVYVAAMNERPPSWCEGILRSTLFNKQRSAVKQLPERGQRSFPRHRGMRDLVLLVYTSKNCSK